MAMDVPPHLTVKHCGLKVCVGASSVDSDAEDEDGCVQGAAGSIDDYVEHPGRPKCQICRRQPGRRVTCGICQYRVGPGCCLHSEHPPRCIFCAQLPEPNPQEERAGDAARRDESLLAVKGAAAVDENTLVYRGLDPVVLEPQDGAWVPVSRSASEARVSCEVVLQLAGSPFEVAPGLWDTGGLEGLVFVANVGVMDVTIASGDAVAQVALAEVQTRLCSICGAEDTDAWELSEDDKACKDCGVVQGAGSSWCRQCGAMAEAVGCLSYSGCPSCRPEMKEDQCWRRPGVGEVSSSAPSAPTSSEPVKKMIRPKEYPKGGAAAARLGSLVCVVQFVSGLVGRVGWGVGVWG